jgi:hypothetical protein
MRIIGFTLIAVASSALAQTPAVTLDDVAIQQTPEIRAVCLSGRGGSVEYAKAFGQIAVSLMTKNMRADTLFTPRWEPGSDPAGKDAEWDICAEVGTQQPTVDAPLEFRTLAPQEAAHAFCTAAVAQIPDCLAALDERVRTKEQRIAAAPARYSVLKSAAGKNTYEIWMPLRPLPPRPPAPAPPDAAAASPPSPR